MSCITLLSDLGITDASVASVKGILLQHVPSKPIIDISHHVAPFHTQQAAYLLASSYYNFPTGSKHIVLFDLFKQSKPTLLLAEKGEQYFLAPDNGIIPLAFNDTIDNIWLCHAFEEGENLSDWVNVVAILINQLEGKKPSELGFNKTQYTNTPQGYKPIIANGAIECQVIHIDRFENVVLNVTKDEFDKVSRGRAFRIEFVKGQTINKISKHYNSVRHGERLCRFNSAGYLEIALNRGNAAGLLGLELKNENQLIYQMIKIYFE